MGVRPKENKERNLSLYNDHKSGISTIDLIHKYQISSTRVFAIIKREEKKENAN